MRELNSLEAILERLASEQAAHTEAIAGAGTGRRLLLQVIATRAAHDSALPKADPRTAMFSRKVKGRSPARHHRG